jgi:hypothetical protein
MSVEQGPSRAFESAQVQRAGLRRSMGDTEAALAAPAAGRADAWVAGVDAALHTLQVAFDTHVVTTEDPDGILEEIVRLSPRLANPVTHLRRDHIELRTVLDEQIAAFDGAPAGPDTAWVNDRRAALTALLARLARHRQHGADLTYEAYGVDIGGET